MRICFVCLGNICRSPTAEGVMAAQLAAAALADRVTVDSAGTGNWHVGELPDARSRAAARRRGIELVHRARQLTRADIGCWDLVVVMDRDNFANVLRLGFAGDVVRMFRSFDPTAPRDAAVPDPYSGGDAGFEEVLDQCERACAGLVAHVREKLA